MSKMHIRTADDGKTEIWMSLDSVEDPTDGNAESFIVGIGDTREAALQDALADVLDNARQITEALQLPQATDQEKTERTEEASDELANPAGDPVGAGERPPATQHGRGVRDMIDDSGRGGKVTGPDIRD